MHNIKIREDLHDQYINDTSNITFKELEESYNKIINIITSLDDSKKLYTICLITKDTGKLLKYNITNKFYEDKDLALEISKGFNEYISKSNEEYCIEEVIDNGYVNIVKDTYKMLNTNQNSNIDKLKMKNQKAIDILKRAGVMTEDGEIKEEYKKIVENIVSENKGEKDD